MRWSFLLLLLAGCHFGWSTWQGAPPRASNNIRLALQTPDDHSRELAHRVLAHDPKVTVVDVDPAVPKTLEPGCAWAKTQQLDYYAHSSAIASYSQDYVCTSFEPGSILDPKDEGHCKEGHYENQRTHATFTLTVYDVATCEKVPGVSSTVTTMAEGEEDQSKPASLLQLDTQAQAKTLPFPEQLGVNADGSITADNGYYALYRNNDYRGFVAIKNNAVRSLHCCDTPSPGDALIARGPRKLIELVLDGVIASYKLDGERRIAAGVGTHLRYMPLDRGVRFGFGVDLIGNGSASASALFITGEVGYGFRPTPAISLSANGGVGFVQARQTIGDMHPYNYTPQAQANLRVMTFFTTWWYAGADVGYAHSGEIKDWESGLGRPMQVATPFARAWLGVDL